MSTNKSSDQKYILKRREFFQVAGLGGLGAGLFAASGQHLSALPQATAGDENQRKDSADGLHPAHPFWPSPRLRLVTDHKKHRSRGSGLVILDDKWLFFWREANIHGATDRNAVIKMGQSHNGGQTIQNIKTIYDEGPASTYNASDLRVRLMANGRIGLFAVRNSFPDADWVSCIFMHSDDQGETWTSRILETGNATHPGFTFNEYPASVGGHDTNGFIVFFKSGGRQPWPEKESFVALYTTDNGDTWKYKTVMQNLPKQSHEMSVVRLGHSNRWVMTWRQSKQRGLGGIATSTDLLNWDGPYDTNTPVPGNPSTILYHKGHITWIAASRPYHYQNDNTNGIAANGHIIQGLVTKTANAEDIWRNPTKWPQWSELIHLPVHFDGTFVNHQGHLYMIFGAVEGPMGVGRKTYSQLGVMSSTLAPGAGFDAFLPGWMAQGQ